MTRRLLLLAIAWVLAWTLAGCAAALHPQAMAPSPRAVPPRLWVVYEAGDSQIAVVDVAHGEVIKRFPSRSALLDGAQISPDGRFLYVGTQSGWITQYDLHRLSMATEVRVGFSLRHLALSSDGRFLAAASDAPRSLVLLSADLQPLQQLEVGSLDGRRSSRIAALHDAAPRKSFVAALEDVPELWEIAYDKGAAPIFDGYVHDYRMGEAIAKPGFLNPRRTPLEEPLAEFAFDTGHHNVLGTLLRPGAAENHETTVKVVNLDVRRQIAALRIPGEPRMGSGTRLEWNGHPVLASPNRARGAIDLIDLRSWKLVTSMATPGPGTYVRTHAHSPYLWTDATPSEGAKDTLTLLDKRTLKPATTLRDAGHRLSEAQFSQDGRDAVVLADGKDGALIVLDAQTLREIKRIPVKQARWALAVPAGRASP